MKTFIRRPGNKSRHLRHIIPLIPKEYNTYIEPFTGTGAVFLNLLPEKWIINDLNKDIINVWKLIRDDPDYLLLEIEKFKKTFIPLSNGNKSKTCRDITSKLEGYTLKKRTVMYLLMVYCSFLGSIERNNKFYFGALYGHVFLNESIHIFTEKYKDKIKELSLILKNGNIYNKDYINILKMAKKGDFVFIDPPYIEDKTYSFQYNRNEKFDLQGLAKELQILDKKGVKWMMTQIDNEFVRKTFLGYKTYKYDNRGYTGASKDSKKEVIFMNY